MKTNNKQGFFASVSSYIVVTFLDLYFTFLATPNLSLEGNPLYNKLFFGWTGLITINILATVFYILIAYYAFVAYKRPVTDETDLKKYLSYISYGDSEKYSAMMWKFPKYWAPQIACLCWSVAIIIPFAKLSIVFVWFEMLTNTEASAFLEFVSLIPMARIDVLIALFGAWALSGVWILKEFKLNLKNIKSRKENNSIV